MSVPAVYPICCSFANPTSQRNFLFPIVPLGVCVMAMQLLLVACLGLTSSIEICGSSLAAAAAADRLASRALPDFTGAFDLGLPLALAAATADSSTKPSIYAAVVFLCSNSAFIRCALLKTTSMSIQ